MKRQSVATRKKVVVVRLLDDAARLLGITADSQHFSNRRLEAKGTICAWIGRQRNHIWVNHGNGLVASYLAEELEIFQT